MIRDITFGQYYNIKSLIHSLDPRVKLFATFIFLISLFISTNPATYVLATILLFSAIYLSNVPIRFLIKGVKSLILLLLISVIFNMFLTPGRVVFKFLIFEITYEGIKIAIKMTVRLVYLVIASSILTLTTTPNNLTAGLEKSFKFLNKFKIPVSDIALMMSISLRFVPILIEETDKIMKAQMSRGADFESGNLIEKAKALLPLLIPLFVSAFRRANDLAYAMEARCFSSSDVRTKLNPLKYDRIDYISYFILILYIILIIITKYIKI